MSKLYSSKWYYDPVHGILANSKPIIAEKLNSNINTVNAYIQAGKAIKGYQFTILDRDSAFEVLLNINEQDLNVEIWR